MFLNNLMGTFYGDGWLFLSTVLMKLQSFLGSLLNYEPSWQSSTPIMKISTHMTSFTTSLSVLETH